MNAVRALHLEHLAAPRAEALERQNLHVVEQLSPELKVEKYVLLSLDGKLLGPELSRIRSEMALPLERLDIELPQDLPKSYLSHQRRSLPAFPFSPMKSSHSPPGLRSLRRSTEVLCAGHFPTGLSQIVTGMQSHQGQAPMLQLPQASSNMATQPGVFPSEVASNKTKTGETTFCWSHGHQMQLESAGKQQQMQGGQEACGE